MDYTESENLSLIFSNPSKNFPAPGGRGFTLLDRAFFLNNNPIVNLSNRVKGRGRGQNLEISDLFG
jgi:hypothetical protein